LQALLPLKIKLIQYYVNIIIYRTKPKKRTTNMLLKEKFDLQVNLGKCKRTSRKNKANNIFEIYHTQWKIMM